MSRRARGSSQKGGAQSAPGSTRMPPRARSTSGRPRALKELQDWHAIAILGAAVAIFFREVLLRRAFFWEDWLTQVYPFRTFAAVSLAEGTLPLWNPFAYGGMPFQADIQSAVFYLPNVLLTLFVREQLLDIYWIELLVIAHYWLAGVTMFFLARELGLQRAYALFAGLAFGLSGFMIARAIHPGFVEQTAWLPLVVLLQQRALIRKSVPHAILGGLVMGHAMLAGAPQISLFSFSLLGLFSLFVVFAAAPDSTVLRSVLRLRFTVLLCAVAVAVAAVQLLPSLELAPLSERASLTFEESQDYRLAWPQLITAIVPGFFGVSSASESSFWASPTYGVFWEACFYVGIATLLLAAFSVFLAARNRYVLFFVAIIVVSLLLAVGDQFILHRILFETIPGFDKFRGMQRILVLGTFALAILSGFGLRAFVELSATKPTRAEAGLLGVLMAMASFWLLVRSGNFLLPEGHAQHVALLASTTQETTKALAITGVACLLGILLTRRIVKPAPLLGALLLLQYSDMTIFGGDQNSGSTSVEDSYREARTIIPHLKEQAKGEAFRVTVRKGRVVLMDQNQGMVDRIALTEGYTAMALSRRLPPAASVDGTYDLLNSRFRIAIDPARQEMSVVTAPNYLPRAFIVHDARVIADDSLGAAFMRGSEFDPRATVMLEEQPSVTPQRDSSVARGRATIVSYGLNSLLLNVDSRSNGILVLSEIFYPGWNAYVDGVRQRVLRANWSLRAIPIRAGSHSVELKFEPVSFRRGAVISLATLLLCCVALLVTRRLRQAIILRDERVASV